MGGDASFGAAAGGVTGGRGSRAALSDEALLDAVRSRDAAALEQLYDRHSQLAMGLAMRLLHNRQLAEDVVQEAFLAVWRQAGTYRPDRGTVRNWILSIVHHRAIGCLRRRELVSPPASLDDPQLGRVLPDERQLDVPDLAFQRAEQERVRQALLALPEEQRQALTLAYYEGLTCHDIATRLSIPVGTVKGRMRLALQKLRRLLASPAVVDPTSGKSKEIGS
jgi:RNA polymerase sigma-70 factor (ECF subfamily)